MDFQRKVQPIDKKVSKTLIIAIAVIIIAIGGTIISAGYLLATYELESSMYGLIITWAGSLVFFYSVITEEHTMKELFLRHAYFFTGIISMILGVFFISLGGLTGTVNGTTAVEFGILIMLLGSGLVLLSAQRSRDYSRNNALFALFAGVLLVIGGTLAGSLHIAYGGIFVAILSGVWLGLRDRYAI
jgi:hypothetical protein